LVLLSSSVSESSQYKFGGRHAFEFYFRQPFTLPGIPACFSAGRAHSSFKINDIKGLLQERLDFHSIQIISYSLKIVFRQNNCNGLGSNEIELFDKRAAIRIGKMIFKNHHMRRSFLSKSQRLRGC